MFLEVEFFSRRESNNVKVEED